MSHAAQAEEEGKQAEEEGKWGGGELVISFHPQGSAELQLWAHQQAVPVQETHNSRVSPSWWVGLQLQPNIRAESLCAGRDGDGDGDGRAVVFVG